MQECAALAGHLEQQLIALWCRSDSRVLQKTPSNHNEQAASLVAQYLGQSPRSASDLATGYGALKRGKKQGDDESQGLKSQSASTTADVQQPASDLKGFMRSASTPLVSSASTPVDLFPRPCMHCHLHASSLQLDKALDTPAQWCTLVIAWVLYAGGGRDQDTAVLQEAPQHVVAAQALLQQVWGGGL